MAPAATPVMISVKPLTRKIKRAAQLTLADWRYLTIATAELLAARIRLSAVATEKILRELQAPLLVPIRQPKSPLSNNDVERLSWAIVVAAQHVPWRSDCLIRTIAADRWLRRHHLQPNFYLGVAIDEQGVFAAHAWLRYGDISVTGGRYDQYAKLIEPEDQGTADRQDGLRRRMVLMKAGAKQGGKDGMLLDGGGSSAMAISNNARVKRLPMNGKPSERLVSYTMWVPEEGIHAYNWWQLRTSVTTLREHNQTIPVRFCVLGQLPVSYTHLTLPTTPYV